MKQKRNKNNKLKALNRNWSVFLLTSYLSTASSQTELTEIKPYNALETKGYEPNLLNKAQYGLNTMPIGQIFKEFFSLDDLLISDANAMQVD